MTSISHDSGALEDSLAHQDALLDEWVELGQSIGAYEARRAELLASRLDLLAAERRTGLGSDETAFQSLCAEFAAAGHLPPSTAAALLTRAWVLVHQLPATHAALAEGAISRRHADVILAEAPNVPASTDVDAAAVRAEYEAQVVPFAQNDSAARTRVHARGVSAAVYPEGLAAQHRRARSERSVTVKPDGDGAAVLIAILPEILAYAIRDRLTTMARESVNARPAGQRRPRRSALEKIRAERDAARARQEPTDPEPPAELEQEFESRFDATPPWEQKPTDTSAENTATENTGPEDAGSEDAGSEETGAEGSDLPNDESEMTDTADGPLFHESTPMHDGYGPIEHDSRSMDQLRADIFVDLLLTTAPTSTTGTALGSIRANVQVTIAGSTLVGHDENMAELDGHGPLEPDPVRILAGHAGSWDRLFLSPTGMTTRTDNYVPTASMKRFLRARDQHCRFPGCRAPSHRCQIDHNHDHAKGGPTALNNLALFCTAHHPLKHPDLDDRDRWTAAQLDNGTILWTSPAGRTYTDEPPLRVMFA